MGKFICFMGKSSTGKDTIFQKLLEDKELGLKTLVPYTTRPIRGGEVNGVEYFFTDEEGYRNLLESGKIIEERTYDTYYGPWRYFTVDDGNIDLKHQSYAVIVTLEAYNKLCEFFGKDNIVPVLIEVDDGIRLARALEREKKQENPGYEELCRRYLADCEDFGEEKIKEAGIGRRFYNDDLEHCLKEIKDYIVEIL
jgi:guanylate kinase